MDTDPLLHDTKERRILRIVANMVMVDRETAFKQQEEVARLLGGVAGASTTIELLDAVPPSEHEATMATSIGSAVECLTEAQPWQRTRIVDRFQGKGAKTIADILTLGKHRARSMQNFGPISLQLTEDMLRTLGVAEHWKERPNIDDIVIYCATLDKVPYLAIGTSDDALLNDMSIATIINLSPEESVTKLCIGRQQVGEHGQENIFVPDEAAVEQIHAKAQQFAERFELAVARRS